MSAAARAMSVEELQVVAHNLMDDGVAVLAFARLAFQPGPPAGMAFGYLSIATSRIPDGLRRRRRCLGE